MQRNLEYYFTVAAKTKEEWEKQEDNYTFIERCYLVAQQVPVADFRGQYLNVKSISELKEVRNRVAIELSELDSSSLNRDLKMYTPITQVKEELLEIYKKIICDLRDFDLQAKG